MGNTDINQSIAPIVSVIIINWNGADFLPRCLDAVMAQSFYDYEVIIVDNGSSDGSTEGIEDRWPDVKVINLDTNVGFAKANNIGAKNARGRWLALLNNDAFTDPDWLENLLTAADQNPGFAFFASRLLQFNKPDTIDATGDIYHASGLSWHRDRNRTVKQASSSYDEVFSACAAAALYDREAFFQADGFDEDYFSHHEDIDLGFRLRLLGYRCLYVPDAVVNHIGSASFGVESNLAVFQMQRNYVWTYLKNMPGYLYWLYLPVHLFANLVFVLHYSLRGQGKQVLQSKLDAIRGIPKMLRKRREIQRERTTKPSEIRQLIDRGWFSPYMLGKRGNQIRNLRRYH